MKTKKETTETDNGTKKVPRYCPPMKIGAATIVNIGNDLGLGWYPVSYRFGHGIKVVKNIDNHVSHTSH